MKVVKIVCTVFLLLNLACSKQGNSNIKNTPELPNNNQFAEEATPCSQKFTNQMTPAEVAAAALKMKETCKMTEQEIINLAEKF
ncbi:hypothetical protein K2P97_04645 [bacterium]|nr:hypothetical protein [bacterium]